MARMFRSHSSRRVSRGTTLQYSDDPVLAAAELVAREKKVGVWSVPNPTAPWAYGAGTVIMFGRYELTGDKGSCAPPKF